MLVTCSIGRTSHQSLILYTVARLDTRWRDIEDGNGLPVTASLLFYSYFVPCHLPQLEYIFLSPTASWQRLHFLPKEPFGVATPVTAKLPAIWSIDPLINSLCITNPPLCHIGHPQHRPLLKCTIMVHSSFPLFNCFLIFVPHYPSPMCAAPQTPPHQLVPLLQSSHTTPHQSSLACTTTVHFLFFFLIVF